MHGCSINEKVMAICFDMQISFLDETINVHEFSSLLDEKVTPYKNIHFHPLDNAFHGIDGVCEDQLNIIPKNVGLAVPFDDGDFMHKVDDKECFNLSLHMYEFIKDLPKYQIALVGWEIGKLYDFLIYNEQGKIVDIEPTEGLVISNELFSLIKDKEDWVVFDSNHMWIPCESALGNLFTN
ncbi:MAG: hypothetical protein DIZ80_00185 [endosymbiont of Galathealinum brachiosum]|uniref:Uncharacterized protein n=1 Tax=endosymbiont of Galathealinum brachiosum TaxID=2200906 RepID=A0A370DMY4_9GAMM|nr:MAG: hypothetical protein DIZ80_00185 [endosymbiont of Galathealinum brachiosum]